MDAAVAVAASLAAVAAGSAVKGIVTCESIVVQRKLLKLG